MRKRLTAIISLIVSVFLSVAFLTGCTNLITKNTDKDMKQVVATVSIQDGLVDDITKSDLIIAYNFNTLSGSTGGYSTGIEGILTQLVNQRIILQTALIKFEEDNKIENDQEGVYEVLRYLDDETVLNCKYSVYKFVNSYVKSFAEKSETTYQDSIIDTVRTTPTNASVKEKELTQAEKRTYIERGIDYSDRKAVSSFINMLKLNGLCGDNYNGKVDQTTYFKKVLVSEYENKVVSLYQEDLAEEARKSVTFDSVKDEYSKMFNAQKNWSNSEFTEKLSSATVGSPILYSAYGNFGYVYNLLLGVSDSQKTAIESIKDDYLEQNGVNISDAEYELARRNILQKSIIKDLRSTWVLSNYNVVERSVGSEKKLFFTDSYTFTTENNSLPFQGEYNLIKEANAEENTSAQYSVTGLKKFTINSFIEFMDDYIDASTSVGNNAPYTSALGNSLFSAKKFGDVEEYDEKINELLFAFSSDPGSLNGNFGYVIKPEVDGSNTEEYVKTFGDAGRILLEQGSGYVVVASDFGYHVLFFSALVNNSSNENLIDYLNTLGQVKTADEWAGVYNSILENYKDFEEGKKGISKAENFLYNFVKSQISTSVSVYQNKVLLTLQQNYLYNSESNAVKMYKNRIADLI